MSKAEKFLLLLYIYLLQAEIASVLYDSLKGIDSNTWLHRVIVGIILVVGACFIFGSKDKG